LGDRLVAAEDDPYRLFLVKDLQHGSVGNGRGLDEGQPPLPGGFEAGLCVLSHRTLDLPDDDGYRGRVLRAFFHALGDESADDHAYLPLTSTIALTCLAP
jgi:hypothetical protein